MNRRFSRSLSYYAPRSFLGAVKAVTLIKQGTLMNWRRYRKALLLTGERRGIRVVRLIHPDSVGMSLYRQTIAMGARFRILDYFAKRSHASLLQFLCHVIVRGNERRKTFTSDSN